MDALPACMAQYWPVGPIDKKVLQPPRTAPPAGDQMFACERLVGGGSLVKLYHHTLLQMHR